MPRGRVPTAVVATPLSDATSVTGTSPEPSLDTHAYSVPAADARAGEAAAVAVVAVVAGAAIDGAP